MDPKMDESESDIVKTPPSVVSDAFSPNPSVGFAFDRESVRNEMDRSELLFAKTELARLQLELDNERDARWRAECNLSRAGSSLVAARCGLEMVLARLNEPDSTLHAGWEGSQASRNAARADPDALDKLEKEKDGLRAKLEERDAEIQALKEELADVNTRLEKATEESSAAVVAAEVGMREELAEARAESMRYRLSYESQQTSTQLVLELAKVFISEKFSPEEYPTMFKPLFESDQTAAVSEWPGSANAWTIELPCLKSDDEPEDDGPLTSRFEIWGLFVCVFSAAKARRFNTINGVRSLKTLASHLKTTPEVHLDMLNLVLRSIVDGLDDAKAQTGACAETAMLLFYEISNIVCLRWPMLKASGIKPALVKASDFGCALTLAMASNTATTIIEIRGGISSFGIGMLMRDDGSLLVVDQVRKVVWLTKRWTARYCPQGVKAYSRSGATAKMAIQNDRPPHRKLWQAALSRGPMEVRDEALESSK
ncbi:hypothetical protein VTJ83DRAFT_160 [Remersonia thermophila]|uniref:Uncharacterized protein n=1 Tax=Remersonia thermophila TaxID=72144 RepID=A0ABR4DK98_9PEZI